METGTKSVASDLQRLAWFGHDLDPGVALGAVTAPRVIGGHFEENFGHLRNLV